jgi:hypothetical protein
VSRRFVAAAAACFLTLLTLMPVGAFAADDGSAPGVITGSALPDKALPGTSTLVESAGWPAFTQVQAVVCGDLGIGGSNTCDQSAGQLGAADKDGKVRLDIVVGDPPRPCPCILRVASYSGPALSVDIPFKVQGHPVGTPPTPESPAADVQIAGLELEGTGGVAALFGAPSTRRLVVTLVNQGNAPAVDPQLVVGVGRTAESPPTSTTTTDLTLDPLQTTRVAVDVSLPVAAFGTYYLSASVATETSSDPPRVARTTWKAYPWGLVALNLIGIALVIWGIFRRTIGKRRVSTARAKHRDVARPYPLPDVVYVESIGGFLVSPGAAGRSGLLKKVGGRLEPADLAALLNVEVPGSVPDSTGQAVVDMAAAERWLARRSYRSATGTVPDLTGGGPVPDLDSVEPDAVVDLAAVDQWLGRRRKTRNQAG